MRGALAADLSSSSWRQIHWDDLRSEFPLSRWRASLYLTLRYCLSMWRWCVHRPSERTWGQKAIVGPGFSTRRRNEILGKVTNNEWQFEVHVNDDVRYDFLLCHMCVSNSFARRIYTSPRACDIARLSNHYLWYEILDHRVHRSWRWCETFTLVRASVADDLDSFTSGCFIGMAHVLPEFSGNHIGTSPELRSHFSVSLSPSLTTEDIPYIAICQSSAKPDTQKTVFLQDRWKRRHTYLCIEGDAASAYLVEESVSLVWSGDPQQQLLSRVLSLTAWL